MVTSEPHLFLSGGLDSRIAAAAYGEPLKTVTLYSKPNIETKLAYLTSKILGLEVTPIIPKSNNCNTFFLLLGNVYFDGFRNIPKLITLKLKVVQFITSW